MDLQIFRIVAFAVGVLLPFTARGAEKSAANSHALSVEDLLVLLDASYAKIRVIAPAKTEISLCVIDENRKIIGRPQVLKIGPSGVANLAVMAKNVDGITGKNEVMTLAFNWSALPFVQKGLLKVKKNWDFRKGTTLTDGYTKESFNSIEMTWDVSNHDLCEITRIWWSPREISPVDAGGNVKQVGAVVLQKLFSSTVSE